MSTLAYWPVRIETATEVVEALIEAKQDRDETFRMLVETYARLAPVVIMVGRETVEAPAGRPGEVERLADVVARS